MPQLRWQEIQEYFPYETVRPHQDEMLDFVYQTVKDRKVGLINAPTGSGKSSVVAAVLAATTTRPVLVAVRTVSQLNIFVRELQMIREKKQPSLRFCYIVGKGKVCRVFGEIGVNDKCKLLKRHSKDKIKERCEKAQQVGLDGKVVDLYADFNAAAPDYCPWYVESREINEEAGIEGDSQKLAAKAEEFSRSAIPTDNVRTFAGDCCPYEMMRKAAYMSEVVVVNYQHVLNCQIRNTFLGRMYAGGNKPILIIDEAHNVGNALEELHSLQINGKVIDKAAEEFTDPRVRESVSDNFSETAERIPDFLELLKKFLAAHDEKYKSDSIFDFRGLWGQVSKTFRGDGEGSFDRLEYVLVDLNAYQDSLDSKGRGKGKVKDEEKGCENLLKVLWFLKMLVTSTEDGETGDFRNDRSVVKVFVKNDRGSALKLRSIDPSEDMLELKDAHESIILMSGTLYPLSSYGQYLFGDDHKAELRGVSLPNTFPRKNRRLLVAEDVTSAYAATSKNGGENENNMRIYHYIRRFIDIPGNLAVFFPSYSMMRKYYEMLMYGEKEKCDRILYMEPQNAREAMRDLEQFMRLPEAGSSGVMMAVSGGKWSEGIDYRGETLVGAMIVGLPLALWNPIQKWINEYYVSKFRENGNFIAYTLPALNRAQQALGRVIRDENDKGFLVLCEKRYVENLGALPEWMQDEVIECDVSDFGDYVNRWVKS